MLPWSIVFVVIALVAAVFTCIGFATGAAGTAQLYFFVFIVISVLLVVARVLSRRRVSRMTSSRDP